MAAKSRLIKLGDYSLPHRFTVRIGYLPSDTSESVVANISAHFCSTLKIDFFLPAFSSLLKEGVPTWRILDFPEDLLLNQ